MNVPEPTTTTLQLFSFLPSACQPNHPIIRSCKRRHGVQYPRYIAGCHLAILQTANLAALAQSLQTEREFPALRLIDEEDVLLAIGIADRSAEDV